MMIVLALEMSDQLKGTDALLGLGLTGIVEILNHGLTVMYCSAFANSALD